MSREHLLAAIKQSPAEDTPRLMYADWLDEYAENDRDRATAEFIRMTCKGTTGQRNAIDPKVGKWLYPSRLLHGGAGDDTPHKLCGVARLCPALVDWMNETNRTANAFYQPDVETLGYPVVYHSRNGRWLNLKYRAASRLYYSANTDVEFWRGFVRRAVFRTWEEADIILPKLLEDQPLCEPEFHHLIPAYAAARDHLYLWEGYVGKPVADHLMKLPFPFRPDTESFHADQHRRLRYDTIPKPGPSGVYENTWRARWAVCMAMRLAAEDVLAGRRLVGWPVRSQR